MGFLDELKAQAEALQNRQRRDEAAFERNALRTDEACKTAFHYWLDLARQLELLRPPVPVRYVFEPQHVLDGPAESLHFEDFQVDARRHRVRNLEPTPQTTGAEGEREIRRQRKDREHDQRPTEARKNSHSASIARRFWQFRRARADLSLLTLGRFIPARPCYCPELSPFPSLTSELPLPTASTGVFAGSGS